MTIVTIKERIMSMDGVKKPCGSLCFHWKRVSR